MSESTSRFAMERWIGVYLLVGLAVIAGVVVIVVVAERLTDRHRARHCGVRGCVVCRGRRP